MSRDVYCRQLVWCVSIKHSATVSALEKCSFTGQPPMTLQFTSELKDQRGMSWFSRSETSLVCKCVKFWQKEQTCKDM